MDINNLFSFFFKRKKKTHEEEVKVAEPPVKTRRPRRHLTREEKAKYKTRSCLTLSDLAKPIIEKANHSTAKNYQTALQSLRHFNHGHDVLLVDIDRKMINDYEHWLEMTGVSRNASSCYMRSLRALYNKVSKHRVRSDKKPFLDVYTGVAKTRKRSLSDEDIAKILQLELPEGSLQCFARDLFMFSIYAMGMPFVDMALLKKTQIEGNVIRYNRQKTGQSIKMRLEPCMKEIIDRYNVEESPFVFPLLNPRLKKKLVTQYRSWLANYNRLLKEVASLAGVETNLTSYVSRHTWASMAHEANVEINVISQAMGHTNPNTTMIYIAELSEARMSEANLKVLKNINRFKNARKRKKREE